MIRQKCKSSRLSYMNLESRKMLAGDVTVVEDGQLYIRGDELSNQIRIAADESGQVLITGLNSTTINGSSDPFVVTGTANLNGARGRNASFDGGLRILTHGGDDRIDIRDIELDDSSVIMTGEGDDFVRFIRSTSHEDLFAETDTGDDTLVFFQARVYGIFDVNSDIGDDSIRLHNSRTAGNTGFHSGTEDDHVILNRVRFTGESQQVRTHDGHDQIEVRNNDCLLYTSPSPRDLSTSRMPSSA